jgi:hypothetical protein
MIHPLQEKFNSLTKLPSIIYRELSHQQVRKVFDNIIQVLKKIQKTIVQAVLATKKLGLF